MSKKLTQADPIPATLGRREVLALGLLPLAKALQNSSPELLGAQFEASTVPVSLSYPQGWTLEDTFETHLYYPHITFMLRSGPPVSTRRDTIPDLRAYPSNHVVLWLLHYDELRTDARLAGPLSRTRLAQMPSEFPSFRRYGGAVNGSRNTYLIELWVGRLAAGARLKLLDASLASLRLR